MIWYLGSDPVQKNQECAVPLGIQGENESLVYTADVSDWLALWPSGVVALVLQAPDRSEPYMANTSIDRETGIVTWTITEFDTSIVGYGVGELRIVSGDVVKKSYRFATYIRPSILSTAAEPPAPTPEWIAELLEVASDIQGVVDEAEAARDAAQVAQAAAELAQGNAETAQGKAEDAQTAAETAQGKAETAQTNAETAASNAQGYAYQASSFRGQAIIAKNEAVTAQGKAETAQGKAETAQTAAETAQGKAEDAQTAAETAQGKAEDAQEAAESALASTLSAKDDAISAITEQQATSVAAVQAKGTEVIASIPQDYSALSGEVGDLKSQFNSRMNFLVLEQGSILGTGANAGKNTDATNRVRTVTKIEYPLHIDLSATDYRINTYVVYNKETGAFVSNTSPQGAYQKIIDITPESGTYVRVTFKHKNGNDFTPGDLQPDLTLCDFETRIKSLEAHADEIDESIDEILGEMDNVTHITNPHLLAWRMGVFTESGPTSYTQGILPTDRFFTIVELKKGSTVSKKSDVTRGRNLSFGYKLSESDETLSGYTSNAGDSITVGQDCIAYIGIRYSNPVEFLKNDEILDTFDFSLDVIDYKSRYNRGQGVDGRYYGFPCPEIYYEGQHTDTTGWDNSMSSIQDVYDAFDALCEASDGYLTRTQDYGVAYTGNADNPLYDSDSEWHLYGYTAKPSSTQNAIKIALTCCVHGNEKMSVYALHYLMYDLIYNSTKNPILSYIKSNCVIRFMPICNPFGFMKATPSRVNENGVNLNRNFPTYNWTDWESGEGTLNYKGASAASETETQLIMKFFRDNYDSVFSVDVHTDGADTQARDQISAFMMCVPADTTDADYSIQNSFLRPGVSYTRRLRPWMNEKYNAGLSYSVAWGSAIEMQHYPSAPEWIRQAVGTPGMCYEVLAGGSEGYIGPNLTVYGADTIKFAAEELGMFLTTMSAHCKDLK